MKYVDEFRDRAVAAALAELQECFGDGERLKGVRDAG
jgi:hypothetical protein